MDLIPSLQHCHSQEPSSSSSLSLPSEPPDIRNWFSSYDYKSPGPDSNVNFDDPAFEGCDSEKDEEREGEEEKEANFKKTRIGDEVVNGEKLLTSSTNFEDDKHNEDLSLAKGLDSFSSCSGLLSEPPDIRNWFSSYFYESPVSGTSSLFGDSVYKEENKHEVRCENVHPRESIFTHNSSSDTNTRVKPSSSRGDGSVEMKETNAFANISHLEKIARPCMQDRTLQHNMSPTKREEMISLSHGSGGCTQEASLTLLDMDKSCTRPPDWVHKNDIKEARSEAMIQHENRGNSTSSANRFSERNWTCLREKENGGDMMSFNGFVTTRKSGHGGAEDENCWKKRQKVLLQDSTGSGTVSLTSKKQGDTKRKALEEVTNIKKCNGMEVTGKWQCPQKGKRNAGPALKQLRLERWVHRN